MLLNDLSLQHFLLEANLLNGGNDTKIKGKPDTSHINIGGELVWK